MDIYQTANLFQYALKLWDNRTKKWRSWFNLFLSTITKFRASFSEVYSPCYPEIEEPISAPEKRYPPFWYYKKKMALRNIRRGGEAFVTGEFVVVLEASSYKLLYSCHWRCFAESVTKWCHRYRDDTFMDIYVFFISSFGRFYGEGPFSSKMFYLLTLVEAVENGRVLFASLKRIRPCSTVVVLQIIFCVKMNPLLCHCCPFDHLTFRWLVSQQEKWSFWWE